MLTFLVKYTNFQNCGILMLYGVFKWGGSSMVFLQLILVNYDFFSFFFICIGNECAVVLWCCGHGVVVAVAPSVTEGLKAH